MKYKALIHNGAYDFTWEEREMPPCGDNDIIAKNLMSSICGSDSDTWLNGGALHLIPPGEEFGHEVVCEIVEVGKNVAGLKVGDRIAPFPQYFTNDMRKSGWLGGFSEYIYGNNAEDGKTLFKLDDSLSNEKASIIEPVVVGLNAADRFEAANEKSKAIILGAGIIGFSIGARLAQKGVPKENITFVDLSQLRVGIVREQGFNAVCTKEEDWKEQLFNYTGTTYNVKGLISAADVIFDAAGSIDPESTEPTLLSMSLDWAKHCCDIFVAGVHRQKLTMSPVDFVFCCYSLRTVLGGGTPWHFYQSMELLKSDVVDFDKIITHVFPYSQAREAIEFSCKRDECMKVLLDFSK